MSEKVPDLSFLKRLADAAAVESLKYFRQPMDIENKFEVGFDPVTQGDKRSEKAIRDLLQEEFPDHGILGEEYGAHKTENKNVWVIDPIDGTRAFIAGLPLWGTLVGLKVGGRAHMGFIQQPYLGELYVADGTGAFLFNRHDEKSTLQTRKGCALNDAIMFTTSPALYGQEERSRFDVLESQVRLCRYGTDCYGAALLASGHADIWIEPNLQPYDVVGIIPVIEQSGGVITHINGGRAEEGGTIIAAGSASLHAHATEVFLNSN